MEFLKVVLLAIAIMGIVAVGLALNILVKKGGKFPNTHVSGNKFLKRKGVHCSQTQDRVEQIKAYKNMKFENVKIIADETTSK